MLGFGQKRKRRRRYRGDDFGVHREIFIYGCELVERFLLGEKENMREIKGRRDS